MKYVTKLETRVIEYHGSAAEFEDRLNAILTELGEEELDVSLKYVEHPTLIAIISYTRKYNVPTTIEDAYHLEAIYPKCADCPHFTAFKDKRLGRGKCDLKEELVHKKANACQTYYDELEANEETIEDIAG